MSVRLSVCLTNDERPFLLVSFEIFIPPFRENASGPHSLELLRWTIGGLFRPGTSFNADRIRNVERSGRLARTVQKGRYTSKLMLFSLICIPFCQLYASFLLQHKSPS